MTHIEFSRRGGSKRSATKTKTARRNGRRGGRPVTRWPASRPGAEPPVPGQFVLALTDHGFRIVGGPVEAFPRDGSVQKWWSLPEVVG